MGKNDLLLAFYWPVKAICAVQRLQKAAFCPFLPIILASRQMDMCASSFCIDSVGEINGTLLPHFSHMRMGHDQYS